MIGLVRARARRIEPEPAVERGHGLGHEEGGAAPRRSAADHGQREPSTQIGAEPGTGAGQQRFPPQLPHGHALQKGAVLNAWQRPAMQSSSLPHPLPHWPQFAGSLARLVQAPLHVVVPAGQPAFVQAPFAHT